MVQTKRTEEYIQYPVDARATAKKERNFDGADKIRLDLAQQYVKCYERERERRNRARTRKGANGGVRFIPFGGNFLTHILFLSPHSLLSRQLTLSLLPQNNRYDITHHLLQCI